MYAVSVICLLRSAYVAEASCPVCRAFAEAYLDDKPDTSVLIVNA